MKTLIAPTLVVGLMTTTALAGPSIEDLAPADSLMVMGVNDFDTSFARLKRTPLWELWNSDEMAETREEMHQAWKDTLAEMRAEMDIDLENDEFTLPGGGAGAAVFAVEDPELGLKSLHVMGFIDYAEHAEQLETLFEAMLENAAENDVEIDDREINGVTVYTLPLEPENDDIEDELDDEFEDDFDEWDDGGPMDALFEGMTHLHIVRQGGVLAVSTDLGSIRRAIEVMGGDAVPSIKSADEFNGVMNLIDRDGDWYFAMFPKQAAILFGGDPMAAMMVQMFSPTLKELFGAVHGVGIGGRLDGEQAMAEQTFGVYMPDGVRGITALMNTESPREAPPFFAGADAISYGAMNFNFSGLTDTMQRVVNGNPMLAQQAGPMLDQMKPMLDQLFGSFGNQMHMVTRVTRPMTMSSMQQMMAIRTAKADDLINMLAQMGPQMGMQQREFLGHQLFTMDPAMMGAMGGGMGGMDAGAEEQSMSVGVAAGYTFIGGTPAVEQALRASDRGGDGGVAEESFFERGLAVLPDEPAVGWGVTNLIEQAEYMAFMDAEMNRMFMEQFGDEFGEEMDLEEPDFEEQKAFYDLLRRYIGPMAWQLRAVEGGFKGVYYLISADD